MRPIAACAMVESGSTRVSQVTPESPGIPRAMVYGLFRALPGDRAFLPPSPALLSANLTPASGRQDHTSSPSASAPFVIGASASTASRLASVTIANRPSVRRDGESYSFDLGFGKTEIFLQRGLDREKAAGGLICPSGRHIASPRRIHAGIVRPKLLLASLCKKATRMAAGLTSVSRSSSVMRAAEQSGRCQVYLLVAADCSAVFPGSSSTSCASHEETAPGTKPTSPYRKNWTTPLSGPREP
jgi:hypothetical protein